MDFFHCRVTVRRSKSRQEAYPRGEASMKRFLAFLLLAVASAPAGARWATGAWAPQGTQAPISLRVNDPFRGQIPFAPVHGTLLPDGRVMLVSTVGVHSRAAWFRPTPLGEALPPVVDLVPQTVPVNINAPIDFTDMLGRRWHFEETIFCSGHALMSDGSIFIAGGTFFYSVFEPWSSATTNWIYGMPNATLYHYPGNAWYRMPDLVGTGATGSNRRWYGTVTRLADERMLITSGFELADIQRRVPNMPTTHH